MAKPKQKAKLQLNKKPAAKTRTNANMDKFLKKRKEIISENAKRVSDHKKAVKKWEELNEKVKKA